MGDTRKTIPLPYLLAALFRSGFTGKLRLEEGDMERTIVLNDGLPMQVQSSSQEETLGRLLLQEGKIDSEQYDRMLEEMVASAKPAGEVLIKQGVLGPHEIFSALEFQTLKKLSNTFRMVDFEYTLIDEPIPLDLFISNIDISETLLSGILSSYTVDRILDEFPAHEDTVFMAVKSSHEALKIALKELRLLRSLGTGMSLSKVMASGMDLRYLLALLYTFHALGMVEAAGIPRPDLPSMQTERKPPSPDKPTVFEVEEEPAEDEFRQPTLDNIMRHKINTSLAQKVLRMGRQDHFALLGVSKNATKSELHKAYSDLVSTFGLSNIESTYSDGKERDLARSLLERASTALDVLTRDASRRTYIQSIEQGKKNEKIKTPPRILADIKAHKATEAIQMESWDEARKYLEQAISLYPKEPSYHFQLGRAMYLSSMEQTPKDQKLAESIKFPFLKALKLDPHYDQPRLYLGYIAKRNGDYETALKEMHRALECNPHNKLASSEVRLLNRRMKKKN